jgi:hypothetical protein
MSPARFSSVQPRTNPPTTDDGDDRARHRIEGRIASIAASWIFGGVSKSGSPTDKSSRDPWATQLMIPIQIAALRGWSG